MLTHPIHITVENASLSNRGHYEPKVTFYRSPDDNAEELRRYASEHIRCYYDKIAAEQSGNYNKEATAFVYFATIHYSRSAE